jgi:hypothetical protein
VGAQRLVHKSRRWYHDIDTGVIIITAYYESEGNEIQLISVDEKYISETNVTEVLVHFYSRCYKLADHRIEPGSGTSDSNHIWVLTRSSTCIKAKKARLEL